MEAIRFYTEMFTKLKVAPPSTLENDGLQLRRLFMAGAIAHYQGTPTEIERFEKDAPNLDYGIALMPYPTGKQTSALLGGWSFVVAADGKNKAEAQQADRVPGDAGTDRPLYPHLPGAEDRDEPAALRRPAPRTPSRRC